MSGRSSVRAIAELDPKFKEMKTLLIATDLSANAAQVAGYAYRLAQSLKAKLLLCYAINIPAEIPQDGTTAWPLQVYDDIDRETEIELERLKTRLTALDGPEAYKPEITCVHEPGFVTDVLNDLSVRHHADLIIIGMHGNDRLGTWLTGNHSSKMIGTAVCPLLLIPAGAEFKPLKRIAFGSDFKQPGTDLKALRKLEVLAEAFNAELVLTHVDQGKDDPEYSLIVKATLTELMRKLNHGKASAKMVKSEHIANGLEWLVRHGHIDLLAMDHHQHGFFDQLIHGSRTQQAAIRIPVPLLVFNINENEN